MKKTSYSVCALFLSAGMIFQLGGCGKKESSTGSQFLDEETSSIEDTDPAQSAESMYQILIAEVSAGMQNGWESGDPGLYGFGSFVMEEGCKIGYLIQDLDNDETPELLLAKLTEDEIGYRILSMYRTDEDGILNVLYRGNDVSEMVALEDGLFLVLETETSGADSGKQKHSIEQLSDYELVALAYMTDAQTEKMKGYLISEAGLSEADALSLLASLKGQRTDLDIENFDEMVAALSAAYDRAIQDGPIEYEFPEDVQKEIEQVEAERSQENETEAEQETQEAGTWEGDLLPGAYKLESGSMNQTEVPEEQTTKALTFTQF